VQTFFEIQSLFLLVLTLVMLVLKAWAFVDAATRRPEVFVAADKLTKTAWLIILGLALVAHLLLRGDPTHILNLVGAVAVIVYLVDARPAMRSLTRR
jgi:hypothetical protein